jgi:hypothetical protein
MERCEVVLCADSFGAHAGPLFGCATLVIARAGLENWRTPYERSFYFDVQQPFDEVVPAMQSILSQLSNAPAPVPLSSDAIALHCATRRLKEALAGAGWNGAYEEFTSAYSAVAGRLRDWPRHYAGLLCDVDYNRTWRSVDGDTPGAENIEDLRTDVNRWENTNLRKFVALAARGVA